MFSFLLDASFRFEIVVRVWTLFPKQFDSFTVNSETEEIASIIALDDWASLRFPAVRFCTL